VSEKAFAAAYRATTLRLDAVSGRVWGDRVYTDHVPANTEYPYVWVFWSGGGELNWLRARAASLMLTVQCVSLSLAEALAGAEQIAQALNDHGAQDDSADHLNGGPYWSILTVTEEDTIHLYAPYAGAIPIYQHGARYRYIMEEI